MVDVLVVVRCRRAAVQAQWAASWPLANVQLACWRTGPSAVNPGAAGRRLEGVEALIREANRLNVREQSQSRPDSQKTGALEDPQEQQRRGSGRE